MLTAISRFDSRNPSASAAPSSSSQSGAPKGLPSSVAAAPTGPTSRDFTLLILELHRLLHCMENDHTNNNTTNNNINTSIPWQGLERRMELLQSLWQNVQRFYLDSIMDGAAEISHSDDTPTPKWYLEYEQRVYRASQKAQEAIHALQRQEKELYFHTSSATYDNSNSISVMMASQTSGLDMTAAAVSSVHSRTSASSKIIPGGNNNGPLLLLPGPKLIQQVFFASDETKQADEEEDDDDGADDDDDMADIPVVEHDLIGQPMPSMTETNPQDLDDDDDEPQRSNHFRNNNNNNNNNNSMDIAAFQNAQREQIEQAIAQMAQQMKHETERIHQTLQGQTNELLEEMEDIAIQNVDQVTEVTQDVTAHVQQGWTRTWGTYTLLVLVASLFLFSLTVIYLIPKYNSPVQQKPPSQLCRMVNGKEECLDVNAWLTGQQREEAQQPEPQEAPSLSEQQDEPPMQEPSTEQQQQQDDGKPDLYDQAAAQEQEKQIQAVECEIGMDGSCLTETAESIELEDMKLLLQKRAEEEQQRAWDKEQKRLVQQKLREDEEEQKRRQQQQLKEDEEARRQREWEEQQQREMQQREQEQQQQKGGGEQLADQQTNNDEESQWQDDQDRDQMREEEEEENSEEEEARKRRLAQQWRQEADSSDDDDDDDDSQIPGGYNGEEMTDEERLIEEELRRMEAEERTTTEEHVHEHHQQEHPQAQHASMQTGDYPEEEWAREKERLLKERADRERLHVLRQMQEQGGYSEQDLEQILAERETMKKHREEQLLRRDEFRERELRQLEYQRQQREEEEEQQQQQQQHPPVKESQERQNPQEAQESAPKEAEAEELSEEERRKQQFWARQKAQREEAAKKREEQRLAKERQQEEARQREEEERRKAALEQESQGKLAPQQEGAREAELSKIKGFGDWEPKGFGSFGEDALYRPRAFKEQDLKGTWNANLPKGFGSFLQDDPPPMGFGGGGGFAGAGAGANTAGTQAGPGEDAASVPPEPEFRGAPFAPRDIRRVAASGDIETLRDYLDQRPGWVDRADKNNWTALHLAVRAGHKNIVEVLLVAGANVNERTVHEQTPLSLALERMGEHDPLTMVLRNYGAEL